MMAGTVATVPSVKRAVHHLTAPRHHAPIHHAAARAAAVNCDPVAPAGLPAVPLVTYAAPIPAEPDVAGPAETPSGGAGPILGALAAGAPAAMAGGVAPAVTPTPTPAVPGAVPEPATWLLMIGGIGATGVALRRRRRVAGTRSKGATGGARTALVSGAAVDAATTVAARSAVAKSTAAGVVGKSTAAGVAGKSTAAGVAGKALLCVCPAVVAAGGVMTVPALRHAVHAYTAPAVAAGPVARPCDGPTAIPVSATSLNGFPASVSTVPASAKAAIPATAH